MKLEAINNEWGQMRLKMIKGEPWFVAKDVCENLGLTHKKGVWITNPLHEDDYQKATINTNGGKQDMILVNESGLYQLIFKSRKPEAKKFTRWVTKEVLPSIRKYGFYTTDRKRIDKAEKRIEQKAIKAYLSEMKKYLSDTDIKLVAKQCRMSEWDVRDVLDNTKQDPYMLSLLYTRATGNKLLVAQFYTKKGTAQLLQNLQQKTRAL